MVSKEVKQEVIETREALIEMYKAGFLDAYKIHNKLSTSKDWADMNKQYKLKFMKRFEKKLDKHLKEKKP